MSKKFPNVNPYCPWNDPVYADDVTMPWNDPLYTNDPYAPWNDPMADELDWHNWRAHNSLQR